MVDEQQLRYFLKTLLVPYQHLYYRRFMYFTQEKQTFMGCIEFGFLLVWFVFCFNYLNSMSYLDLLHETICVEGSLT